MNKRVQAGFTIWELLLLLIILIILILAGWYVWNANKTDDTDQQKETSQSQNASGDTADEEEEKDPTQDWLLFTAPNEWYSVRIPDGWNPTVNIHSSTLYCVEAAECLTYSAGQEASVGQIEFGSGGSFAFFLKPVGPDSGEDEELFFQNFESTGAFEAANVTGNTYKRTVTEDEPLSPEPGDTVYGYAFTKGDHNIFVKYAIKQGQSGDLATVETMLKTLQMQ